MEMWYERQAGPTGREIGGGHVVLIGKNREHDGAALAPNNANQLPDDNRQPEPASPVDPASTALWPCPFTREIECAMRQRRRQRSACWVFTDQHEFIDGKRLRQPAHDR